MKTLLIALAAATTLQAAPTNAQFNAALAASCPDQRTPTRNIHCARAEDGSIQFSCHYQMQGADGRWSDATAILQLAEGEWVWIDGPTRCASEEEPSLN
jgi:hypothetical protein